MNNVEKTMELFDKDIKAINIGLESFADSLYQTGADVIQLDWQPPAGGDADLGRKLAILTYNKQISPKITEANQTAINHILGAQPLLVDVQPAKSALGLEDNVLLHAGPPVDFENMCGPLQGAMIGAVLYEGKANSPKEAEKKLVNGNFKFEPCHHYRAVGPMAGVISPSMPVFVVQNETEGNLAFSGINEGLGKVLRFGAYDKQVLERLEWIEKRLAPVLKSIVSVDNPIDLRAITAQALQMGDECHNRNVAATSLLFKEFTSRILDTDVDLQVAHDVLKFIGGNDHFFLNLSMASCKAMLDTAIDIPYSTIVTAMSRNGGEFGIRVSGLGEKWFTAPAEVVDGLYFPGYSSEDAALDLGDSSITETAGIGGFAMAVAPAIVRFVGGNAQDAMEYSRRMRKITAARNQNYTIPSLDFAGTATGIDIKMILETGIVPIINTGIAHKDAGIGQIGAGVVHAPMSAFVDAFIEYFNKYYE